MVTVYVGMFENGVRGSRILLERACREAGVPLELRHDEKGRPYLEGGPEISLSHTRSGAALALSDHPVGVDLEGDRGIPPRLAERIMSPAELSWFQDRGAAEADFFTLWTLKESYFKYLGTGLPGFPNGTEFYLKDGLWRLRGSALRFFVWKKGPLSLALCCQEQEVTLKEES